MNCPRCGYEKLSDGEFCRKCGAPFDGSAAIPKSYADIKGENDRLKSEIGGLRHSLGEVVKQQTATSEILHVIRTSPTDIQLVFDAIAERAMELCRASSSGVLRFDGTLVHIVALGNVSPDGAAALRSAFPMAPSTRSASTRAILTCRVVNIPDILEDREYGIAMQAQADFRSVLSVPMLCDGKAIGGITVGRPIPGRFADSEVALLQTFADQAVIAIENVRLFTELQHKNEALIRAHAQVTDALERQTAPTEILRIINTSQEDLNEVFDVIARNAARLCDADLGGVMLVDNGQLVAAGNHGFSDVAASRYPRPVDTTTHNGRAIIERRTIHIPDVLAEPSPLVLEDLALHRPLSSRSQLSVPMMRGDTPIGVVVAARHAPGPFAEAHIDLLRTFADQAAIASANARLFKELQARTEELTRSVAKFTALDEVGRAIGSTLDLQTVLRMIVVRATELSGADAGVIYEYDEPQQFFVPRAIEHLEPEIVETMLATPVRKGEGATGRLAEAQEPIGVPDILGAPTESRVRDALVRARYRALLAVPLVWEDHLLGGLTVIRRAPGAFPPEIIELLRTFATQSALAIQNARLFREIEIKSRELEAASRHKSEFLANMSHELRTPLNAIIGFSEVLSERMFGELNAKQDEYLKDIHASGQHLLSLINDILDLSKVEAGKMELELSAFDLPTTIDNALTQVRERAARRGITLRKAVDARLGQIEADERKLRQVLLNLLSNAIKFTPEGGRIEVGARAANGSIEVSVADTGVGIAPEDQEAVFEEFRQVGSVEKKVEGTGLGLALSRKFIELHGGRISVKSQRGQGSTFTFTIPVRRE
jgi:two-component system, NtrC family, sensor kinase